MTLFEKYFFEKSGKKFKKKLINLPRNVNIHGHNTITASNNSVGIMVVTSTVSATSHGNNPTRLWHLIVDFPKGRSHLKFESNC